MSKTKTNPKIQAQRKPGKPAANLDQKQQTARKAAPAATANAAVPTSRAKGRADSVTTAPAVAMPAARRPSKIASIEALLRRAEGAAITELTTVTGWQQHSVRAALTGLRKQGHTLTKKPGATGGSIYRITQDQQAKA